jgi:hypothetical protein
LKEAKPLEVRQLAASLNSKISEIGSCEGGSELPHSKALFERISEKTLYAASGSSAGSLPGQCGQRVSRILFKEVCYGSVKRMPAKTIWVWNSDAPGIGPAHGDRVTYAYWPSAWNAPK